VSKTLFALFAGVAITAFAEDRIPSLVVGEKTFRNVKISTVRGSDVFIIHDGGGTRVPISDLPAEIQEKYNLAPEKPKELSAEEKAKAAELKKKADEQRAAMAKAASWRGEPVNAFIQQVKTSGYIVTIEGEGTREIRINGLPKTAAQFYIDLKALDDQIPGAERRLKEAERALAMIPTSMTGTPEAVAAWQYRRNAATKVVHDAEDAFEELLNKRKQLLSERAQKTGCSIRQTAMKYGSLEIWEYVGPAVERKRKPSNDSDTGEIQQS